MEKEIVTPRSIYSWQLSVYSPSGSSVYKTTLLNSPAMLKIPLEVDLSDGPLKTMQVAEGRLTPHLPRTGLAIAVRQFGETKSLFLACYTVYIE